jgi:protein-S-isoprenylcysteine O-methyltransferase Ste14
MFIIVAFGVYLFANVTIKTNALKILLQVGDFSKINKRKKPFINTYATIYWCLVVVGFLIYGSLANNWEVALFIFPAAGIIYAALYALLDLKSNKK